MNIESGVKESVSAFYVSNSDQEYVSGSPVLSNPQAHSTNQVISTVRSDVPTKPNTLANPSNKELLQPIMNKQTANTPFQINESHDSKNDNCNK